MNKKRSSFGRRLVIMLAVFALLIAALLLYTNKLETKSQEEQLSIVRDSVRRALVTCYAVEGGYPESIDYLKQHYGLAYDEERIHVYYDAFASNIMPDFKVSMRGDGMQ